MGGIIMSKKSTLVILVIIAILVTLFTGCGQADTSSTTPTSSQEANSSSSASSTSDSANIKAQELDMLWFADGAETVAMQKVIDQYTAEHSNVKINLLEVPFEEMSNKIRMAVSGGEAPALARTTEGILSNVADATVDIGSYVEDKKAFLSQFMTSVQSYFVINGKICGVQTDVTANGMIYNKTAFDKAGVVAPTTPDKIWTWDQFVKDIKIVMEKGGVKYGMVIDNPTHRWCTMLYQFGGRLMSEDGPAFNSPETIECIKFTKKLFDDGIVPKSIWLGGEDPNNMFRSGQVAVHFSGNWMLTNYRDNIKDFEWGVCYCPVQKNRSSVPGGKQLAAFANSGAEKEAVDFIIYATSQKPNAQYCSESLFISPRLDNANITYDFGSDFFAIFANELANTVPYASYDWGYPGLIPKIGVAWTDGMPEVIAGKKTPEQFAGEIEKLEKELVSAK